MALLGTYADSRTIATIATSGSATFAHGLGSAPNVVIVSPEQTAVASSASVPIYASQFDATNVTVNLAALQGNPVLNNPEYRGTVRLGIPRDSREALVARKPVTTTKGHPDVGWWYSLACKEMNLQREQKCLPALAKRQGHKSNSVLQLRSGKRGGRGSPAGGQHPLPQHHPVVGMPVAHVPCFSP